MNQIIWSPEAEIDLSIILNYLNENWQNEVALNFIDRLDKLLIQIQNNPFQFALFSNQLNIRSCVISKHNTVYYLFENQTIYVLRIFDTRQNPDQLTF